MIAQIPSGPTQGLKRPPVPNDPSAVPERGGNGAFMNPDPAKTSAAAAIQGQLLRQSERREVAIYLRKDTLWVADFIDGEGELIDVATRFRFNCGSPFTPFARRRMILESAMPLSGQLAARIERLHRSGSPRKRSVFTRFVEAIVAYAPQSPLTKILRRPRRRRPR